MDWDSVSTHLGKGGKVAPDVHKVLRGLDGSPGLVVIRAAASLWASFLLIEKDSQVSSGSSESGCSCWSSDQGAPLRGSGP